MAFATEFDVIWFNEIPPSLMETCKAITEICSLPVIVLDTTKADDKHWPEWPREDSCIWREVIAFECKANNPILIYASHAPVDELENYGKKSHIQQYTVTLVVALPGERTLISSANRALQNLGAVNPVCHSGENRQEFDTALTASELSERYRSTTKETRQIAWRLLPLFILLSPIFIALFALQIWFRIKRRFG
jgi:hypothetical protein